MTSEDLIRTLIKAANANESNLPLYMLLQMAAQRIANLDGLDYEAILATAK